MIKTENGITRITGNVPCLIADVTEILRAFRLGVGETQEQKKADDLLRDCIRMAFMSEEDVIMEMQECNEKIQMRSYRREEA